MSDPQKKTIEEILNAVYSGTELAGVASAEEILNVVFNEAEGALNLSSTGSALPAASGDGQFLISDGTDWVDAGGTVAYIESDSTGDLFTIESDNSVSIRGTGIKVKNTANAYAKILVDSTNIGQIRFNSNETFKGQFSANIATGDYIFHNAMDGPIIFASYDSSYAEGELFRLENDGSTLRANDVTAGVIESILSLYNPATGADGGGVAISLDGKDALDADVTFGTIEGSWLDESAGTKRLSLDGADSYKLGTMLDLTGNNVAIGDSAGNGQTNTTAVGKFALQSNTGDYASGFGFLALLNNTGDHASGFGYFALRSNTGVNSSGLGSFALQNNTGASSNGIGFKSLQNCIGEGSNGFGQGTLRENTGIRSNAFGFLSSVYNTGNYGTGLGNNTLLYNQGDNNTAIGYNAWADFLEDTANNATFDNTDVNASTDRITLTAHGFGSTGAYINVKYTQGTSAITGLTDGNIYQVKIIDANTIGFYEADGPAGANRGTDITNAGSGTGHTITPQFTYSDSIVIGNDVNPTASNQINLGGKVTIDTSTGLVAIDYDALPASDPSVKGQLYRDASNVLYVSPGP